MKTIIAITVLLLTMCFLYGCGTAAKQSEFWQHNSMYASWDHMKFSTCGYKNPTTDTLQKSNQQGWWGIPIEGKQ